MGVIRTNAAAAMLGVSPNTLRSWERRFSYPTPRRTAGGHRQYDLGEIEALRAAFEDTHNISSAIAIARERGAGPSSSSRMRSAFGRFDEVEADRLLEESLAVRSLERTVEEVLLPSIESLAEGDDLLGSAPPPEYVFAHRWATGWLAAARRVAPAASRSEGVLVFDASRPLDVDALHAQALELVGLGLAHLSAYQLTIEPGTRVATLCCAVVVKPASSIRTCVMSAGNAMCATAAWVSTSFAPESANMYASRSCGYSGSNGT